MNRSALAFPLPSAPAPAGRALRLSEVVAAMTYALDITEGQTEGHALRSCWIGMATARELGLDEADRGDLYYALLLKDVGRSSAPCPRGGGAARPRVRGERGADIVRQMGLSEGAAAAVRALDERWDGAGRPRGLAGSAIPLLGRVLGLAQAVATFHEAGGPGAARLAVARRAGSWFDPAVVAAFERAQRRAGFWEALTGEGLEARVAGLEPADRAAPLDEARLDRVAGAFARVVDAKSPWTYLHSERVRSFALGAAAQLRGPEALPPERMRRLSRGALLHDIGKLGVSNRVLDKPGRLDAAERAEIRRHTVYGERIVTRVRPFRELAALVGGHHERMDGRGYHAALPGASLDLEVRILAAADGFEALTAPRPYRDGVTPDVALAILHRDAGGGLDPKALAALERFLETPEAAPLLLPPAPSGD